MNDFVVHLIFVKLRLEALIPRCVSLSVCLSVSPQKITNNYKTLQNITKSYKTLKYGVFVLPPPPSLSLMKTVKEASAVCQSFLDGVVIFKLRLGALIPRSVCWLVGRSVCRSVCLSSKNYKKIIKLYKTLQTLQNIVRLS